MPTKPEVLSSNLSIAKNTPFNKDTEVCILMRLLTNQVFKSV
jgi:hypothetical protein